jgi:sarcosine oxidase
MGSSVSYHLSKRGVKTLTLEKYQLNHANGSSHGKTRQLAVSNQKYLTQIPLAKRALELWLDLEKRSGRKLFQRTGLLLFDSKGSERISATLQTAREFDLPCEYLEAAEVRERFPEFTPSDKEVSVYDPGAGTVFAENCVSANFDLATSSRAEFHFDEPVISWKVREDGSQIVVRTQKEEYSADKLILCAGSWLPSLIFDLNLNLTCERQVAFWFDPVGENQAFDHTRMPQFVWQLRDGPLFYGIPDFGDGMKVARHHGGELTSPDRVRRQITPDDEDSVRGFLASHLPKLNGKVRSAVTCIYTNTPDYRFLIDFHPLYRNVMLVSPCSGGGFMFSSVVGELVADMVLSAQPRKELSMFSYKRLSG